MEGQRVKWVVREIYSSDIGISFKSRGDFYSLQSALSLCLGNISHKGIIICNNSAVAIHYSDPYFHVFDLTLEILMVNHVVKVMHQILVFKLSNSLWHC